MAARVWATIAAGVCLAIVLTGFAVPPSAPAREALAEPAKLPFSYLTPEQVADLWRRADRYAEAEAFLRKCGKPSNIERRMIQAAGACIDEAALKKVAAYFRSKLLQFGQQKNFVCDTPQAKQVLQSVRTKINSDVEEVKAMCAACLIC